MTETILSSRPPARAHRAPRVLVLDDEADLRELLELTLVGMGLDVDCAADLASARRLLAGNRYALCLTDMRLPDGNGLQLVAEISRDWPDTPVVVITAYGSAENAVAALKAGAFDYLSKPVALDALRSQVRAALQLAAPPVSTAEPRSAAASEPESAADRPATGAPRPAAGTGSAAATIFAANEAGGASGALATTGDIAVLDASEAAAAVGGEPMLGVSPAIDVVRAAVARLARSMAPVAITGESGAGKEMVARMIHQSGIRARQPFVAVNCGAIPETLMEAEFFGHRKGAFTGADRDRDGFFQAATGGTLFLDEVADLPLAMQVKLLRAIQEKRVRRIGGTIEEPVDVRIVSATHQDLARCVAAGRFRQDLYYRLNVIELKVPPLRERREDIPVLADAILARLAVRAGWRQPPRLASVTLKYLQSYGFPGNVRELENILERAIAFSNGEVINVEDLGLRPMLAEASENEPADADDAPTSGAGSTAAAAAGRAAGEASHAAHSPRPARLSQDGIPESLPDYLDQLERDAIARALDKTRHNRTAAARLLGISFRALRYRMQRLGMQ